MSENLSKCRFCCRILPPRTGRGRSRKFCGDFCRDQNKTLVRSDAQKQRRRASDKRFYSKNSTGLRATRLLAAEIRREARPSLSCGECGNLFKWPTARPTKYCSRICKRKADRRVYWHSRRARMKGAPHGDRVNPTVVFERDGWLCHICGGKTSKSRRGTHHPKAPELDHIVPLGDGGLHTYENTACSHRSCNWLKGATTFGQPSLLASLQLDTAAITPHPAS
jgi:hypothetical protein